MHPYSTDSNERKWIIFSLLLVSVILSYGFIKLWDLIYSIGLLGQFYFVINPYIDFSVVLIFEMLYYSFNKWFWKIPHMLFVEVPNLNGKWKGTLISSYGGGTTVKTEMTINQTWQNIELRLKTDKSSSKTISASFITKNHKSIELIYHYESDPNPVGIDTMHKFDGTGKVTFAEDMKSFTGTYYTGRDSMNHGSIEFKKIGK